MQENTAKTAAEWVFVARSVAQLPGGQDQALRCMARAGMAAQDVADWLAVAKAWAETFNDSEMARQCMSHAESHAENSDSWNLIADVWEGMGYYYEALTCRGNSSEPNHLVANYAGTGKSSFE